MFLKLYLFILPLCLYLHTGFAKDLIVNYPVSADIEDHRDVYPRKLLQLICANTDLSIVLRPLETAANQERNLVLIEQGELDIYWSGASKYRESEFLSIKFPIYKGLLGYRLILLKQENAELLATVKGLAALKKFSIGQGSGWPDVKLYLENNFVVHTTTQYPALFEMLQKGRFDLFPRSIIEVWEELNTFSDMNIVVDEHILLRYPYAMYFYVNKNNVELAAQLHKGFSRIIASGEFDTLFERYIGTYIRRAKLNERQIIDLPNPLFNHISAEEKAMYYQLK
jgi:hypothetical protein